MKILKYIILLLLLFAGTLSVFVATKDGSYHIKSSKVISVPKHLVYKYVADRQNWDSINPWKNETWKITNSQKNTNESILFNLLLNDENNEILVEFKDTLKNQTSLNWSTKGAMNFNQKFLGLIGQGTANNFEDEFEEALLAINATLTREVNSYNIKMEGFVKRDTLYYIQRPLVCKTDELPKYIKHYVPKLQELLKSTDTPSNGEPFLIYHKQDSITDKITFSIAVPTKKKIFMTSDSDIFNGQIDPQGVVKIKLTGNYSHKTEAIQKAIEFAHENSLEIKENAKVITILTRNITNEKLASKWVTEIQIPVKRKKVATKVRSVKKDTVNTIINSHFSTPETTKETP